MRGIIVLYFAAVCAADDDYGGESDIYDIYIKTYYTMRQHTILQHTILGYTKQNWTGRGLD